MKTLVIIPTYNELQNLPLITSRVRAAAPEVDILVVDDNSPDGTGEAADKLAAEDSKIHVLHRAGKGGLCGAYVAGFRWGLEQDFDVLCEMDADGSHAPEELHRLLEQIAVCAGRQGGELAEAAVGVVEGRQCVYFGGVGGGFERYDRRLSGVSPSGVGDRGPG